MLACRYHLKLSAEASLNVGTSSLYQEAGMEGAMDWGPDVRVQVGR